MGTHRHDGNHIATELETLCKGMGLPVAETDDRTQAVGVLISPSGTRAASLEWFVSTTAPAAREQTEGLADGRAGLLHRSTRAYVHHALTGILQELGYSVAHTTSGLRIEGLPGASAGAETASTLADFLRGSLDSLDGARDRKKRDEDGDDGDDGLAGVPARV
ncbi:hypothetical protein [Streptomyces bluensis]|uniref:hypothetical protein n=1 Tax=Streptomyces bluensis TaxID=33897 RepID=UPI001673B36B|nr:hypothetical protein [Streptomyces bluensis]GGZ85641.1 hypothetical protein GCM10010344_61360 [Streptomyces bluensis]